MRAVLQRVTRARVTVQPDYQDAIEAGLLIFLGVDRDDTEQDLTWLVAKVPQVRLFEDAEGRMNRSLRDTGGGALVISQFTLFGNLRKGTRPSFNQAAPPEMAQAMYSRFCEELETGLEKRVARGVFAAHMVIDAVNDGPVTLVLDTKQRDF